MNGTEIGSTCGNAADAACGGNAADAACVGNAVDVVCVGQAVVDCIVRGREKDEARPDVFRAESIRLSTGGDALNEAVCLAKAGRRVRLVCAAGADAAGRLLLADAARFGVDTGSVTVTETLETPVANLVVRPDGSRYSINSRSTRLPGYVPEAAALYGAGIVSFASLFRAPLDDPETVRGLLRAAKETGAVISCDTKLPTFRRMALDDLAEVLPLIDYIFPNEKEAAFYAGGTDAAEQAAVFRRYGVKNVIVKQGPLGIYADLGGRIYDLPADPVDAVDTTGCGDSFVAGFLDALLDKKEEEDCLRAGLALAASCAAHMGAH